MQIEEFLKTRIREVEARIEGLSLASYRPMQSVLSSMYQAIEWHKNWPVLVEEQIKFDTAEFQTNTDLVSFKASKKIAWLTNEEYRKRFGDEPPVAPLLRIWAMNWRTHPDFQEEWAVE